MHSALLVYIVTFLKTSKPYCNFITINGNFSYQWFWTYVNVARKTVMWIIWKWKRQKIQHGRKREQAVMWSHDAQSLSVVWLVMHSSPSTFQILFSATDISSSRSFLGLYINSYKRAWIACKLAGLAVKHFSVSKTCTLCVDRSGCQCHF